MSKVTDVHNDMSVNEQETTEIRRLLISLHYKRLNKLYELKF